MITVSERSNEEIAGLARLARSGDAGAFEELVRLHRTKAFGIAKRITRDPQTAEDIVQDALIRAFRHIDRLADAERFAPWLSRIVRNEALMSLRRSSRRAKEFTFSDLTGTNENREENVSANRINDLDGLLYRLSRSARAGDETDEPENAYMRQEFFAAVHRMLHGLSSRERDVFEAFFYRQLGPQEIAQALGLTEANVYKLLARSRRKAKAERVREYLRDSIDASKGSAGAVLAMRIPPEAWKSCETSLAVCVHQWLLHAGYRDEELSDVMGRTGQAFRLCVETGSIDVSGPSMYFWEPVFAEGLANAGLRVRFAGDGGAAPTAYMLREAVMLARSEIAARRPVIAWDMFQPGFGLLFGFDDAGQLFTGDDGSGAKRLFYDRLGRGKAGGVFVMALERDAGKRDERQTLRHTIGMIAAHAYGELTFPGYACGFAAYDVWVRMLREGAADPLGNAYTIRVAADARLHAIRFLRGFEGRLEGAAGRLAFEAEGHYYETAGCFARLSALFPFPEGGIPADTETARTAAKLLQEAKEHEEAGLESLKRLARLL